MGVESILKHVADIAIASAEEERTKHIRELAKEKREREREFEQCCQSMDSWLNSVYAIEGTWYIRKEGSVLVVDVDGNVRIKKKGAPQEVKGNFYCIGNESLTTLKGAPQKVEGVFDCSGCIKLESLEGAPKGCREIRYPKHLSDKNS